MFQQLKYVKFRNIKLFKNVININNRKISNK
jgi:hypothetical protein